MEIAKREKRVISNVTQEEKKAIEQAARKANRTVSDFLRLTALDRIQRQLQNAA